MSKLNKVYRFNTTGNDAFTTIVREKKPDILDRVDAILKDTKLSELVETSNGNSVDIEIKYHEKRFDHAEHLWNVFGHGKPLGHLSGDVNLWNWCSAAWMREIVKSSGGSLNEVLGKQEARWLLTQDTNRYHRHLVSGPFFALAANYATPANAMCMLATPVIAPGELVERIAGKRSLSIGSACHLATLLYYDPKTKKLRDGITSKPGNPKAFSYYFSQLDVNVDYLAMDVDALLDLLPKNFERWVKLAKDERKKGLS